LERRAKRPGEWNKVPIRFPHSAPDGENHIAPECLKRCRIKLFARRRDVERVEQSPVHCLVCRNSMRRIDIGERNDSRIDAFVAQLTWPLLNIQPWGYLDIPPFWRSVPAQLSAYIAESPSLRRRPKVATPKSFGCGYFRTTANQSKISCLG
jgi:hypothetical protein